MADDRSMEELQSIRKIHWCDNILFYEYFHGDNGAGLGASRRPWTGIIARAMHLFATTTPEQALELAKVSAVIEVRDGTRCSGTR